jgi:signal peptidase I
MNDDQSMRDLVADGHGPGEQATELGPQPDGQAAPATPDLDGAGSGAGSGEGAQDQAGAPDGSSEAPSESSEDSDKSAESGKGRTRRRPFWVELAVLIVLAMTIALVIKSFVVQAFYIPSSSMETTLLIGDKVLVNKLVYHLRPIKPGDIVVFDGAGSWVSAARPAKASSDPVVRAYDDTLLPLFRSIAGLFGTAPGQTDFIKRVIGVPGDHVACCNAQGLMTVNGVALHEKSYLYPGAAPSNIRFHVTVPPGRLWVMGDNRQVSDDSRLHGTDPGDGTIPENMVIGRAFMIVWPLQRWRVLPIPSTFDQPGISTSATAAAGPGPVGGLAVRAGAAAPYLPLAGGFAAALPLTWVERRVRLRAGRRAGRRPGRGRGPRQR